MSDDDKGSGPAASRYVMPTTPAGQRLGQLFNSTVAGMTKLGISLWGSRVLYVRGRTSGEWRSTPVNVLTYEGRRYLVAPRGHTQWVRNLRVAGGGELRVGKKAEPFTATELPDERKPEILRAYLKHWKFEVGVFFDGVGPDAADARLLEIAPGYPVFVLNEGQD
ncbi:MAG TPA: nitroreductase/quinone reductase family protein [Streptosporangiaceae bacterium]|nr:nitroreductase/quinone reductase family protein [Streptosporangiaceae bacterium]